MKGRDDLDKFYSQISDILDKGEQGQEFPKYFFNSYSAGDNKIYQKNISETKKFDDEWIKTVESYFPSLDKITKNPKSFIKYEEEVTDIERAKKINSKSVQHLASHTQFIRDINEDESVVPKKILTTHSELDFEIYENRFIFTLINRLFLFVKNRYEVIKNNVESFQKDHLNTTSNFKMESTDVSVTIDLVVKKDLDDRRINSHNYNLLSRVEKLNELVSGLKGSQFMIMMKNCKIVRPPIMKTNIILKNPEFKNAYLLWLFLDRYNTLGYDVDVREKDLTFDPSFQKDLERLVLLNYSTILGNQDARKEVYNAIGYEEYTKKKTKIVKTNASDVVQNPDLIQIEDNTANEYFLMKYRKLFADSVTNFEEDGKVSSESAMRKAIRETTEIVNGLYESVFELQEETDIFKKLIKEEDLDKSRDEKKNQLKYAKMIREIKEVDYNAGIRREKRLLKELIDINNKIIKRDLISKQEEQRAKRKALYDKTISAMRDENAEYLKRIKELEDLTKLKEEEKATLQIEREKAAIYLKEEIERLKIKEKERIAFEKEEFEKAKADEKKRLAELKVQEKEAVANRKIFFEQKLQEEKENNALELKNTQEEYENKLNELLNELEKEKLQFIEDCKNEQVEIERERVELEKEQNEISENLRVEHQKTLEELVNKEQETIKNVQVEKEEIESQRERERIAIEKVKNYEQGLLIKAISEERNREDVLREKEVNEYTSRINNIKDEMRKESDERLESLLKEQLTNDEIYEKMKADYEKELALMKETFDKERNEYLERLSLEEKDFESKRIEQTNKINELSLNNELRHNERLKALEQEKEDLINALNEKNAKEKAQRDLEEKAISMVKAYEERLYQEKLLEIEREKEIQRQIEIEKQEKEIQEIKQKEEMRKKALIELKKKQALDEALLEKERAEKIKKEKALLLEQEKLAKQAEKEKIRLAKIVQKEKEDRASHLVKEYEEKLKLTSKPDKKTA